MLSLLLALACLAQQGDTPRDAVALGRTHDKALYDAFIAGYQLTPSGDVDSAEVITEFRRAVTIVRQHADMGEYSYNENNLATDIAPYRGLVTFIVQARLNPLNIFQQPPKYEMYIQSGPTTRPIVASASKRDPVFPPGMGGPGATIIGVRLEATFSRADIASATEPYLIVTDEKGNPLWRARVDLGRYR